MTPKAKDKAGSSLVTILSMFPKTGSTAAVTGHIPMGFVWSNEEFIALAVAEHEYKLRRVYYGPRQGSNNHVLKEDATSLVLYRR